MAKRNGKKQEFGADADDIITGSEKSDHIDGLAGADKIIGMKGNDHLDGSEGDDILDGGSGNDHLDGGPGADTLLGGDDNDKLTGGDGNDAITGGSGNDNIIAGAGDDVIFWRAGDGNDEVDGGPGTDDFLLITSDIEDQNVSLHQNEKGELEVTVSGQAGGHLTLTEVDNFNVQFGAAGGSLNLGNVEGSISEDPITLGGGDGSDVIDTSSSSQAVTVDAGAGDDTISSGSGSDTLSGGKGNDTINAGEGDDNVLWKAGDGNDTLDGGDGFDELDLTLDETQPSELSITADENGNVILQQPDGTQLVVDGIEDIVINAGAGGTTLVIGDLTGTDIAQDTLYFVGGAGADSLDASATDRRLNAQGNGGNDTLLSGSGNDTLDGGAGNDYLDAGSGPGVDTILGGSGDDTIAVTLGDEQDSDAIDIVDGGAHNDQLQVLFVEPTLHDLILKVVSNGDGSLTITTEDIDIDEEVHVSNVEGLQIIAGEGALNFEIGALGDTSVAAAGVDFEGSTGDDAFNASQTDVETRQYGHDGDDNLIGGSVHDQLHGGSGDDSLSGEGGDDVLSGGTGNDVIDGGAGVDVAWYADETSSVTVDLGDFTAQDTGSAGIDTIVNVENLRGSEFDDVLTGSTADNFINGGAGNDVIVGGDGFDIIFGGDGDDTLTDSPPGGLLSGDAGNDTIHGYGTYFNDPAVVKVNLSEADVTLGGDLVLANTAIDGYGDTDDVSGMTGGILSAQDDFFVGSDERESVFSRSGSDTINMGGGDDTIISGSGNDAYDGGDGNDFISFFDDGFDEAGPATQGVTVNLAAGDATDGWGHSDTITNVENVNGSVFSDDLTGDGQVNVLIGRDGDDTIYGGGGNDSINGGGGDDTLTGGTGTDTFAFDTFDNVNNSGHDTITDFNVAEDVLDLALFEISDLADVQAIAAETGGNTTLTIDSGRTITLTGVALADLTAANFVFAELPGEPTSGTEGDDILVGTTGDDVLEGLGGVDELEGLAGADTLDGGDEFDYVTYLNDPSGVTINLAAGVATDGYGDIDTLISIENAHGSNFDDDITGNATGNVLWGYDGDDVFDGGAGPDSFITGPGVDSVDGGNGFDIVYLSSDGIDPAPFFGGSPGLNINFNGDGSFTSTNQTNGIIETHVNVEGVVGSLGADVITGDGGDNVIEGFYGGNTIDGGAGNDTVLFSLTIGHDNEINLNEGYSLAVDAPWWSVDAISNVENVVGSPVRDFITGSHGDNILEGINGDDVIAGLAGDDLINGGQSTLIFYFGSPDPVFDGYDRVDYSQDIAGVTVNLSTDSAIDGWGDNDTLSSIEGVIGSDHDDVIVGDDGGNLIEGGTGNDMITGGLGADTFVLLDDGDNNAIFGNDTITDFSTAEDVIDVTQFHELQSTANMSISQDGLDTLIVFGGGNSVRLVNVTAGDLSDANFAFVSGQDIVGTSGDDNLQGTEGSDFIDGLGGNDNIQGGSGADFILGGGGSDFIQSGDDDDHVEGGNDEFWDHIEGGRGDDVLNAGTGGAYLGGGEGNDTLTGTANWYEDMRGGPGDDTLIDPDGSSTLDGGPGNDILDGSLYYERDPSAVYVNLSDSDWDVNGDGSLVIVSDTALDGYGGTDTLLGEMPWFEVDLTGFDDHLLGGDFSESVRAGDGSDKIFAKSGDDHIRPGPGDDYVDGGDGYDWVSLHDEWSDPDATQGVIANLGSTGFDYGSGIALANTAIDAFGGTDTLINIEHVDGSPLDDILIGSDGHNWLEGQAGDDQLYGGSDGDNLFGGPGNDLLDGQDGNWDTAWYNDMGATHGIDVNLADGIAYDDGTGGVDTLISIENVEGNEYDDLIVGDAAHNWFAGNQGNDMLYGGAGNDSIDGRQGDDEAFGEAGDDWFQASEGDDLIDGGIGRDHLTYSGWTGTTSGVNIDLTNVVDAGGYTDVVVTPDGFGGTDYLRGIEDIEGTDQMDTMIGDAGDNSLYGDGGDDYIEGGAGNDWLDGGDDFDTIIGGADDDWIHGGENDDTLTGGAGSDHFHFTDRTDQGNPTSFGEDVITDFNIDEDFLDLGQVSQFTNLQSLNAVQDGADVVMSFVSSPNGIPETSSIRIQNIQVSDLENMNISYSPLYGSDGNDTLTGSSYGDEIRAGAGDDIVDALDGNDRLLGGPGNDTLDGSTGDDDWLVYRWDNETQGVIVDLSTNTVSNDGFGDSDTVFNIEGVEGSEYNDQITGDAGHNGFNTHEGDDIVFGGAGEDWMDGGEGNDQFFGEADGDNMNAGPGDDFFDGDAGRDNVNYDWWTNTSHGINVDLSNVQASAGGYTDVVVVSGDGHGGTDYLKNVEGLSGSDFADHFTGDGKDNSLVGNSGNDTLEGGAGNDWLDGGEGDDVLLGGDQSDGLHGGAGNDTIDGGADWDNLHYDAWTGTNQGVDVNLTTGVVANDGFGSTDTISGIEAAHGSDFDDVIASDSGADNYISGNQGNDTLIHMGGNDGFNGGLGNDTFVIGEGGSINIDDFVAGASTEDTIDLSGIVALTDMASVSAAATDDGGGVNIDLGNGFNLQLMGVSLSDLHSDDFVF